MTSVRYLRLAIRRLVTRALLSPSSANPCKAFATPTHIVSSQVASIRHSADETTSAAGHYGEDICMATCDQSNSTVPCPLGGGRLRGGAESGDARSRVASCAAIWTAQSANILRSVCRAFPAHCLQVITRFSARRCSGTRRRTASEYVPSDNECSCAVRQLAAHERAHAMGAFRDVCCCAYSTRHDDGDDVVEVLEPCAWVLNT